MSAHPFATICLVLACGLPLTGCFSSPYEACRFEELGVQQGMPRMQVEQRVADIRGEENVYSLYQGGLRGGLVEYRFAGCVLAIDYRPGSLPPYVMGAKGVMQHLAPIDESVTGVEIRREGRVPKK